MLAADVRLEAIARDGLVPAGHPVGVQLIAARRGNVPVAVSMNTSGLTPVKPEDTKACSGELTTGGSHATCTRVMTVPADARVTAAHFRNASQGARYVFDPDVPFGLPFRPTPFTATFNLSIEGTPVDVTMPIQARSEGDIFSGEKRYEIHVVPAFAVSATPEIVVVSTSRTRGPKDVRVTVTNHASGAANADVALELPQGWRATPATQPVRFTREDESMTVRFTLQPPAAVSAGRRGDETGRQPVRGEGGGDIGGQDLRAGLPGGRVSAHDPPPRARRSASRGEGARRARASRTCRSAT